MMAEINVDAFRKKQQDGVSIGGIYCSCCNPWFGKWRAKLNKIARAKLKRSDRNEQQKEKDENC